MIFCFTLLSFTLDDEVGIPPEFGKDKSEVMLCVIKGRKSYDNYMKKNVTKFYLGKYEFVLEADIKKPKYQDTKKYRYIFHHGGIDPKAIKVDKKGNKYAYVTNGYNYYVLDRTTNIAYYNGTSSDMFAALIKKYMKMLELRRSQH